MKKNISVMQEDIVNTSGNVIVRASAGTGKTHTMVSKIAKDIDENKSHKAIAAITFTIKAAGEIRDRLPKISDDHFIGTNNSFVIEEVIKPFIKDVYGQIYDREMGTDYEVKVDNFDEGLKEISERGIIASFNDKNKNFIFELALSIVYKSYACREYLKAKYFKIYVDEYQDCDKDMHDFFMYLCEVLNINIFIVGDTKQSIYMWRGAYPKAFEDVWKKPNFCQKILSENFRSCESIQNYSNILCVETRNFIRVLNYVSAVKLVCTNCNQWKIDVLSQLDLNKKVAILRHKKSDAKKNAETISDDMNEFIYIPTPPIASITTNTAWLYTAIASYFIIDTYSIYDIIQVIPDEAVGYKDLKKKLQNYLNKIKKSKDINDEMGFVDNVIALAQYLGYETNEMHLKKLYTTVTNKDNYHYFMQSDIKYVSMTFHSSKGLEFDQVILFAEDYDLSKEDSIYNHYVSATRAKERLIIVYLGGNKDRCFCGSLRNIVCSIGKDSKDFIDIVNGSG